MFNKIVLFFRNEEGSESLINYGKKLQEKYKLRVEGLYVKDVNKYDIIPAGVEGMIMDTSSNYIIKEWEEIEVKTSQAIKEKFLKEFGPAKFSIVEGLTVESAIKKLNSADILITTKKEIIDSEIKALLRVHEKPIILIPEKGDFGLDNVVFADDLEEKSNKSIFSFLNIFSDVVRLDILYIKEEDDDLELKEYFNISKKGYKEVRLGVKDSIEFINEKDMLIMGNLKHFFSFEKIVGDLGAKLLENSKIPVFIG
ncbi:hypothetical protein [Haliovirga abyssi]|uniref:UspA domain-containing protein n=1 Tax=Haliovirga abyssi TaxID=2996794 RepID=A0AAU9DXW1_9FUSO|nr:hypothetical protein [Haliovirga abyssi]BDU51346.1 hypothetical protein HLVA_19150 [Haliovirga abyssi]